MIAPGAQTDDSGPSGPIFVGGTGRSGTTVVGRLLGEHPRFTLVASELQFHAAVGGLADALAGRIELDRSVGLMRTLWADRIGDDAEAALADFASGFEDDRHAAGAALMRRVAGERFVEMTPRNAAAAPELWRMFPDLRVVHVLRSGLDVAASMRTKAWAPDDIFDCLLWWADRLEAADRGVRELPPRLTATIHLEDLVGERREATYARLLDLLGGDDAPAMRRLLDRELVPGRAHVGRWSGELGASDRAELALLYRRLLRRLGRRGVELPRDAEAVETARLGPPRALRLEASVRLRAWRWRAWRRRPWSWRRPAWRRALGRVRGRIGG